ncbi:conserved Plasmodium protein, unknown function [Plasmodium ovale wallikeri]|uniref:Uncharacterized protein n=2 Tax=Plasmodium ovale TaxID=36330 RepID=A0A1A8YL19_PLAOA|nr:conserved Plasmodium protein, unknown function [Plasmodium ovale wallikeri]SBT32239.1 conserved Plasmodium protein, unknown function [Plasmodium ovale wallikeri]SBT75681.1 conserved Plasmodium protein, unknown function [Plasmodium ovale]
MISLRKGKLSYVGKYLSPLKYLSIKSNFASINFNSKKTKKKESSRSKAHFLFNDTLSVYDRLLLFKILPKERNVNCEKIKSKIVYKYLLNEFKKCFNYLSFNDIIQSIKIFEELEKHFRDDCDSFIAVKNVDKNVLCKANEFEFNEKDPTFHRREVLGKICNKLIKHVHEFCGNELIHFIINFCRWNKNDKCLTLFYNFYFNHVFENLYLFDHDIYKVLFIFNTYITNNGERAVFDEYLMRTNELNVYYFVKLKNLENYSIKMSKAEIYKNCYHMLSENIDKIDNQKVLNILKLYMDNLIFNINIDHKITDSLHKNLISENIEYLIKLINIYCVLIKKEKYDNALIISKLKEVILCICKLLKGKTNQKKVLCDVNYSTLLNSVNNKNILNKVIDKNFISLYEYLLKAFFNIKFANLQSLSISLVSIKNIYFALLKSKYYTNGESFLAVMKFSLNISNNILEKCIQMKNKSAEHIISSNRMEKDANLGNAKEVKTLGRSEYNFYKIENYADFNFKLKSSDLLSIKILSNSFVKINSIYNSYDFFLLFNNILCILYYFIVNKNTIKKHNDTYVYILNDLSFVYRSIKSRNTGIDLITTNVKELICKNILKVSSLYIKNLHEENNFVRDQYVCSLIFLNNLFFDRFVSFHYINNIWHHVYKAYNYFKCNKIINEDIISLLLLSCSKFQFFIENNSCSRYNRKELMDLKYNIIDDLTRNYLNRYKYISLDNLSKILISLSNSKYRYEINEILLLKSLENEVTKVQGESKGNYVCGSEPGHNNSNKKLEDMRSEKKKHDLFVNMSKIIECLIKLDLFLHLKKKNICLHMYEKTFCNVYLKENILKKLLYIANNLYIYELYGFVCEILERSLGGHEKISYNFSKNVESRIFEKIICLISEDDYIEISNTFFVIFFDYLEVLNNEKCRNVLICSPKWDIHSTNIKHMEGKNIDIILSNNKCIQGGNMNADTITNNDIIENVVNIANGDGVKRKCQEESKENNNQSNANASILKKNHVEGVSIGGSIMDKLKFLKIDGKKLILFQLYIYLSNSRMFKQTNMSSSVFHTEIFTILKCMSKGYLCMENFQIQNEEGTFLYSIDIVLLRMNRRAGA